jgi:outer membrane protein assembly factor BamB
MLSLALSLPSGVMISMVRYDIHSGQPTSPPADKNGSIDTSNGMATASVETSYPASANDTVTLTATTSAGEPCTGTSIAFDVTSNGQSLVAVTLTCGLLVPDAGTGSVRVNGTVVDNSDVCPTLTAWSASPLSTSSTGVITVSAAATDQITTDYLAYQWSVSPNVMVDGGVVDAFANDTAQATTFQCPGMGSYAITVTVNDNHLPQNCTASRTIEVGCGLCGNGVVDLGEQCDSAAQFMNQTCDPNTCQLIPVVCGNGLALQPGKQCDSDAAFANNTCAPPGGVTVDNVPGPGTTMVAGCQLVPVVCGNGLVQPGEDCEPPNTTTCDANCIKIFSVSPTNGASVAYQVDPAHTGNQPVSKLTPPLTLKWSLDLGGTVSYPIVVNGHVFVTFNTPDVGGSAIEAFYLQTGQPLWGPTGLGVGTSTWSNAAYDAGRVYAVDESGLVTAFEESTGAPLWATQLTSQYDFTSPPTATGGMVFVVGAGIGATLYGIDGASGRVVWTSLVLDGGLDSSPAVTNNAVYVAFPCIQAYALNPINGALLWHYGQCDGGGGNTPVYYQGQVWARDSLNGNLVLDATSGNPVGGFNGRVIPVFSGQRGFFQVAGTLQALDLTTSTTLWTFGGGNLTSAPLVVNGTIYVGSYTGMLYGIDPSTGGQIWSDMTPGGLFADEEFGSLVTGFGAGDDSLLIPAGTHLLCYQ